MIQGSYLRGVVQKEDVHLLPLFSEFKNLSVFTK